MRFHEGSRAEQTPVGLRWRGNWRPVHLVSESLLEEAGRGRLRRRRLVVQDQQGNRFLLEGEAGKAWHIRPLGGD